MKIGNISSDRLSHWSMILPSVTAISGSVSIVDDIQLLELLVVYQPNSPTGPDDVTKDQARIEMSLSSELALDLKMLRLRNWEEIAEAIILILSNFKEDGTYTNVTLSHVWGDSILKGGMSFSRVRPDEK